MKIYKKSKQRDKILELLRGVSTHPNAEWIYNELKKDFKNLSRGTVYRNLNILEDMGLVLKIDVNGYFSRYDGFIKPHPHFICKKCGKVIDLNIEIESNLNKKVLEEKKLKIDSYRIDFFGLCEDCNK